MPKQLARSAARGGGPGAEARESTLDIVSYGRRGPGGRLRLGADQIALIQRTVARVPEVMVKVSGGGRDVGGVEAHLRYIGRHGKLAIETDEGLPRSGHGAAREITADWLLDLCRGQYKRRHAQGQKDSRSKMVHNIVLSMPAGTDPAKVLAAARVFARENFALQYRYAMVLHTDQPHPHVHLVVKCEHEFEPGKRLYIRKDTLRQWREQFAALMREQGVPANATPRQVRGQTRKPYRDAIHHRLRALRIHGQLPPADRARHRPPKTSTFMRRKLDNVLQALQTKRGALDVGNETMQRTRKEVVAGWHAIADALRIRGQAELADQVERFVARMPSVHTDAQRIADRWRETERSRSLESADASSSGRRVAVDQSR